MTTVLQFGDLATLATFIRKVQLQGYTINTLHLTLSAKLTPLEIGVAIEHYGASFYQQGLSYVNSQPVSLPFAPQQR